jgi:DNA-binding NtrC family response regulator
MMQLKAPARSKMRQVSPGSRLLIADSDEVMLDLMRRCLLLQGYEVDTAVGGVECLSKLRQCSDGILILDLELAWGGGDGVLTLMREDPVLSRIPVILTSSCPLADMKPGLLGPLVLRVLEKPFALEQLPDSVRSVVAEWYQASQSRSRTTRSSNQHARKSQS